MKLVDSHPPETRINIKDHKSTPEGDSISPLQTVSNGKDGLISRIEHLSSLWFDALADRIANKSECISNEDLKNEIRVVNKTQVNPGMKQVVVSMDMEAMYPSLKKDVVKEEIFKVVLESDLEIQNLD